MRSILLLVLVILTMSLSFAFCADNPYTVLSTDEREKLVMSALMGPAIYSWAQDIESDNRRNSEMPMIMAASYLGVTLSPEPVKIKTKNAALKAMNSYVNLVQKKLKDQNPLFLNAFQIGISAERLGTIADTPHDNDSNISKVDLAIIAAEVEKLLKSVERLSLPAELKNPGLKIINSYKTITDYQALSMQDIPFSSWQDNVIKFFVIGKIPDILVQNYYNAMDLGYGIIMWPMYASDAKKQKEQVNEIKALCMVFNIELTPLIGLEKDQDKAFKMVSNYYAQVQKVLKGDQFTYYDLGHHLGLISKIIEKFEARGVEAELTQDDQATIAYAGYRWQSDARKLKLPDTLIDSADSIVYRANNISNVLEASQVEISLLEWKLNVLYIE